MLAPFLPCTSPQLHFENSFLRGIFINSTKFSNFQAARLQTLVLTVSFPFISCSSFSSHSFSLKKEIGNWHSEQCHCYSCLMWPMSVLVQYWFLAFSSSLPPCPLYLQSDLQISYSTVKNSLLVTLQRWEDWDRGLTRCLQRTERTSLKYRRPAWASLASALSSS